MKHATLIGLVVVCALLGISVCSHADTSAIFPVTASIQQQLELQGWMKRLGVGQTDPGTQGTEIPFPSTMAFGDGATGGGYLTSELADGSDAGGLYSPTWYAVFMVAKTSGRPYKIDSSSISFAGISGAAIGNNLDKSFVLTPGYRPEDEWQWSGGAAPQGPDPNSGATVGAQSLTVGAHPIYNSGTGGASRILRALFSLPPYPDPTAPPDIKARPSGWEIVDPSKPSGNYSGQVTLSLTLKSP